MNRTILINHLLSKTEAQKYLEIGVYKGHCLDSIQAKIKDSIDPDHSSPASYKMTSDEFFDNVAPTLDYKYDVIFIDGLHHTEQVDKDITNSLLYLEPNGTIVLHDCNPISELRQQVPPTFDIWEFGWNGDVWKSIVKFRNTHSSDNYNTFVINADEGLGVIQNNTPGVNLSLKIPKNLNYSFLEKNRKELLNLIEVSEFEQLYI
jgi:hypothetical protein